MPPKFGTSGLRGLVTELTGELVKQHIWAFLNTCDVGTNLFVGCDLRESSERIMADVITAARQAGLKTVNCGALPTPALALAAGDAGGGAVMVTGSHIPADRNGLKFYTCQGEITKTDEEAIRAVLGQPPHAPLARGEIVQTTQAIAAFTRRYLDAFGTEALAGRRIGVYAHSAVGRDLLAGILSDMGAQVIPLGRSEIFIPVDTEAVDGQMRTRLRAWVKEFGLDALVSTDGDSDRPLVVDETGQQVPGDILGQITAQYLEAETVVTPVSSNSGVKQKGFDRVELTRIGSPYVIAAMQSVGGRVVGYEANGGFLLGFEAKGPCSVLPPLMTRDSILPIIVPLVAAAGGSLSARTAREPAIVTVADRLQNVPVSLSQTLISQLLDSTSIRSAFLADLGEAEVSLDVTDGLRLQLESGGTLHIRPSGNAPELRIYIEAQDRAKADMLLEKAIARLRHV